MAACTAGDAELDLCSHWEGAYAPRPVEEATGVQQGRRSREMMRDARSRLPQETCGAVRAAKRTVLA